MLIYTKGDKQTRSQRYFALKGSSDAQVSTILEREKEQRAQLNKYQTGVESV